MLVKAVVGINWGDEGKGRMVDYFASKSDCVIRFQGGNNAGHTVKNDLGSFAFHYMPSGVCYPDVLNIVGAGCVINIEQFIQELDDIESKGLKIENIMISDRAIMTLPYHLIIEKYEEERLADKKYGSTMSGIAPTYSDKYYKKGIQMGEILNPENLRQHLEDILEYKNLIIKEVYNGEPISVDEMYDWIMKYRDRIAPYIKDIQPVLYDLLDNNKNILIEAQLGALRDITHGIYPFTTSSSTLAGHACSSIPVSPKQIEDIIGVTKAYSTCVGAGPFVTELFDELGDSIRNKAGEFGAKTGRPRRIGHFDAVATKYGCRLQGATSIVLTCLDVLSGYPELKICTGYDINGEVSDIFPLNCKLNEAKPVYETLPGWEEDITSIREFDKLPENAQKYIKRIEELINVPIDFISVGPKREAIIVR